MNRKTIPAAFAALILLMLVFYVTAPSATVVVASKVAPESAVELPRCAPAPTVTAATVTALGKDEAGVNHYAMDAVFSTPTLMNAPCFEDFYVRYTSSTGKQATATERYYFERAPTPTPTPKPAALLIGGRLSDGATGVNVLICDPDNQPIGATATDATGHYSFEVNPGQQFIVRLQTAGASYTPGYYNLSTIESRDDLDFAVAPTPSPTPSASPTPTPQATPSPSPTPQPTPTPSPSPTPCPPGQRKKLNGRC